MYINLEDYTGNVNYEVKMAENVPIKRIIPVIIKLLKLPQKDAIGQVINHHISHNSRQLQDDETLLTAGVQSGELLILLPEGSSSISNEPAQFHTFTCPKSGIACSYKVAIDEQRALVLMPFSNKYDNIYHNVIKSCLEEWDYIPVRADKILNTDNFCNICHLALESHLNIVDITNPNTNIIFELGIIYGIGRKVILTKMLDANSPIDMLRFQYVSYSDNNIPQFRKNFTQAIAKNSVERILRKNANCSTVCKNLLKSHTIRLCVNDHKTVHRQCWLNIGGCPNCGDSKNYVEVEL